MAKADLIAKAQELGIELTGKETVAQLEELLSKVLETAGEAEIIDETATNTGTPEVQAASTSVGLKASYDVYNSSGALVRTYTLEDHGEGAESLANQYAGKIGGSVK